MNYKIFDQDPSWLVDGGNLELNNKEILGGTGLTEYTFKINSKNKPDDYLECGGLVLVSDKIFDVFSRYKDIRASFSPISMFWNGTKYSDKTFYILETFDDLQCINYDESEYKYFSSANRIMSLYKLVTYPVNTEKYKLFTIDDTCFLCIADYIGDELIDQGCTGFNLIEASDATI